MLYAFLYVPDISKKIIRTESANLPVRQPVGH